MTSRVHCHFIPPYLSARVQPDLLGCDEDFRSARQAGSTAVGRALPADGPDWVVHDCVNTAELPGTPVRSAGEPESGDAAVDEAAYGITGSLDLFLDVYARDSYDGQGAGVSLSVHYEQGYANAFWDGTQLVFGDGDGEVFDRLTKPVDVLGHEFTHAVTDHTAGLVYQGQSGALNESVSDVFGACMKQRLLGQSATEADWVVGAGLFLPGVSGRGLRDMKNPGTAYDDPRLGTDPQPAHMDDFVETTDDNGGVHINSGIPNRAFVLAAEAIGGSTAEGAGRIWFTALTSGSVGADTDFAGFAAATVAAAGEHAEAVRTAWESVGVPVGDGSTPSSGPSGPSGSVAPEPVPTPTGLVRVRRTGGLAGMSAEAEVDLDSGDERAAELRDLVRRVDVSALSAGPPQPDRYLYDLDLGGRTCQVPEPDLTPDLRRIIALVLR